MHHSETTRGLAEAVGDGPCLGCASPLTGHGVAPLRNTRRPCWNSRRLRPCWNSRRLRSC
ncbi:MAG: hypothetical protein LBD24_09000 [Spirochaetaceae bacterium]|nr:hypothetical protein [Spirochaetaceae bacterium]